jgi:glycosyltransferase involved in cell wall biosynthesis
MGGTMEKITPVKLLICTQAVDNNDPVLGFFVRWLEEFAKHCEHIEVVCLREGAHSLPPHVRVRAAGMEGGRILRWLRVFRLLMSARGYDAVFVHMNPEYFVLSGWLWNMRGVRTALWYAHKSVTWRLRIAAMLADRIFTPSKESFRLRSPKVLVVGHGIDIDFFRPDLSVVREEWWLSVGRLDKIKRHDIVIEEAKNAGKELRIVGEGPERKNLEALAHKVEAQVEFLGGLPHSRMPDLFRRAGLFRHASETGSLDKVLLEAIACGCPIRTNNLDLKALESETREGIIAEHSLQSLVPRILQALS